MTRTAAEMAGPAIAQIERASQKDAFDETSSDQVVSLDVREPVESEHQIAGALQVPRGLPDRRSGARAALATLKLKTLRFVAAAGALALAGCGGDDSTGTTTSPSRAVDTAQVESGIKKQLSTSAAEVSTVKCPADVQAEAGATFNCSVTWSNGATGKVKVTQESRKQFTYEPVSGSVRVPGSTVETSIEQELDRQGAPNAQANCPDTITVKLDTTVTCDLSGAGGQAAGTVTFTFSDATGTVDPSSVETA